MREPQLPREDWPRLAAYVISARKAAGYPTARAFAVATGITARTLGKLENGQRVGRDTLADVAGAVGWTPDSPYRVLGGREPVLVTDVRAEHDTDPAEAELARLVAQHPDDGILRDIAGRGGADVETRLREARGWLDITAGRTGNGTTG